MAPTRRRLRLATRGSALAMVQANLAAAALRVRHPDCDVELVPVVTHGDRATHLKLTDSSQDGIFVKELEQAVLRGDADLAVHSAKDLPTSESPELKISAYLPRGDARDVLVGRDHVTLETLPRGARVGTGSPRRAAQLQAQRPDLEVVPIRGNVDTRLRRVAEGAVDAVVLAGVGLERLNRLDAATEWLPFEVMLPAPGQGAIAIQAVAGSEAAALAAAIDDPATRRAVVAERAVLRGLGGGCLSAIGVYAHIENTQLEIRAVVMSDGASLPPPQWGRVGSDSLPPQRGKMGSDSPPPERGRVREGAAKVIRAAARGPNDATVVADVISLLRESGAAHLVHVDPNATPLSGLRILVTRPLEQAGSFVAALQDAGAQVALCPVIAVEPLPVPDDFLDRLPSYDWILFTSVNGVERFFGLLDGRRLPTHVRLGAIGPETAGRLTMFGATAEVVPTRYDADSLAAALPDPLGGRRILLPRARGSRDVLPDRLKARGADIDVLETYRAVPPPNLRSRVQRLLRNGLDVVTFTSSSTVRHFMEALAGEAMPPKLWVACIGPITAATARERGLRVDIIAEEYTARGLRDALVQHRMITAGSHDLSR